MPSGCRSGPDGETEPLTWCLDSGDATQSLSMQPGHWGEMEGEPLESLDDLLRLDEWNYGYQKEKK